MTSIYNYFMQVKLQKTYVYGQLVLVKLTIQEISHIPRDTFNDNHYKCLIYTLFVSAVDLKVCIQVTYTQRHVINHRYNYHLTIFFFGISITIYFSDEFRIMIIDSIYPQIYNFVTIYFKNGFETMTKNNINL